MKKILLTIISLAIIMIVAYKLVTNSMLSTVQDKVIENHTEMENIITINRIGSWGEWFSEYVLVIEIGGEVFRVWANNKGEIVEKEALNYK